MVDDSSAGGLTNWLLPARCRACNERLPSPQAQLCDACAADLPWNTTACLRCALPLPATGTCGPCLKQPPPFDAARVALRLEAPVRQFVHALKYHADFGAAALLGRLMLQTLDEPPAVDLMMPVPLHSRRLRQRGYNQALELARPLAHATQLELVADALRRQRPTADQIGQSARERRRNMRGAFAVDRDLSGLRIVLVDDVMTTGATLAELANVCRCAGASRVEVWAAARTP